MDFQIAQQIRWIRLQNREVREALGLLRDVEGRVTLILNNTDFDGAPFTVARMRALQVQVANIITDMASTLSPAVIENVRQAAQASAEIESAAFSRIMPAGVDVTTPNLGVLQTSVASMPFNGANVDTWAKHFNRQVLESTWREVMIGITEGETNRDLVKRIMGTRSQNFKDGTMQKSRRSLEALVRTSINHATNQGRQAVWEKNSDLLRGIRWVATLDTRTTPICRHRDGRVGPVVNSSTWSPPSGSARLEPPMARPPAHINCRSTTSGVTKSWRDLGFDMDELPPGTRAAMDGQVPGDLTYFGWLERASVKTQKEALGPTRYKLWKEGGVAPTRFQNDKGHLYTLDELKRKTPQAFEDAGI